MAYVEPGVGGPFEAGNPRRERCAGVRGMSLSVSFGRRRGESANRMLTMKRRRRVA